MADVSSILVIQGHGLGRYLAHDRETKESGRF